MIHNDLRREREQERAMIAALRRSAANEIYAMASAMGGNGSTKRQQQVDSRSSIYTERHMGLTAVSST